MSVLAKTDSEASSQTGQSPPHRGAAYFVQSPSRDSANSFQSTPIASPLHSHSNSSLGPNSRESSSTRFSDSARNNKQNRKPWKDQDHFNAIEEEQGFLGHNENARAHRCRFYLVAFVLGFFALFFLFCVILLGASRPQRPRIVIKSILFDEFVVQAGTDFSGVATEMVSLNSTLKLSFFNNAKFFGVHVTSSPLDLSYSHLTVATGTMNQFYQSRKSHRSVIVTLKGSHIPLYGGGSSLSSANGAPVEPVPLVLSFMVRSRAYILGKLVNPKFYSRVECLLSMDPRKMNTRVSLKNKCIYV